jgi:methionyl-tRNA formyltransferase
MSDNGLRIVFAGTPDFAAHHLQALIDSPHNIVGVYTQPDRPAGRGKKLVASPVKQLAEANGLTVYQPQNFKDVDDRQQLSELHADVMVVVAYGLLLPQQVLTTPRYGCINVHASLLPRWRGAAPIQRAIAAGDTESGVTIMQMDIGLDTGDMLSVETCPIYPTDTGGDLHNRLMQLGTPALLKTLQRIENQQLQPQSQDNELANYAHKLSKAEASIEWNLTAVELDHMVRAFNPFPVAYFTNNNDRVRVWAAELVTEVEASNASPGTIIKSDNNGLLVTCGSGALLLKDLQLPGKKVMPIQTILNGHRQRFAVGVQL